MIIPPSKELRIRGTDQCQQLEKTGIHNGEMNLTIGSNKCQCADCGDFFLTVAAFEAHRVLVSPSPSYRRSCATPLTHNWPLERDAKGFWRLPVREFPEGAECAKTIGYWPWNDENGLSTSTAPFFEELDMRNRGGHEQLSRAISRYD